MLGSSLRSYRLKATSRLLPFSYLSFVLFPAKITHSQPSTLCDGDHLRTAAGVCLYLLLFATMTGILSAEESLPKAKDDDVNKLVTQLRLKGAEMSVRLGAVLLLEKLAPTVDPPARTAIVRELIKVVQDDGEEFALRHDATWPLVRLEAEAKLRSDIAAALVLLVEESHHSPALRKEIAEALGRMKSEAEIIVPRLIRLLENHTHHTVVRAAAAGALGEMETKNSEIADKLRKLIGQKAGEEEWPIRSSAILALAKITPKATETLGLFTRLLEREQQPQTRLSTVQGISVIAKRLENDRATSALPDLERAVSVLGATGFSKSQFKPVDEAIIGLRRLEEGRVWNRTVQWVQDHKLLSVIAGYYLLALSFSFLLLRVCPLWILRVNQLLAPYTDVTLPNWLGGIKVPLRYVLLVGFFHYHDRVLDAWIARHVDIVREEFERKPTVRDRNVHVMMPVDLDWRKKERIARLTAAHLQALFLRGRAVLLIHGEGGSGKTSLACQIAKWAVSEDKVSRLCPSHYMIPIMIEYELDVSSAGGRHSLIDVIRGQLAALTATPDPIPQDLLVHLLSRRRLLVIVDRFSELSAATRSLIRLGDPDFPVNALIVTSRIEEPLDGVPKTTITPLRIEGNRLSTFMENYLVQVGKRDLFLDSEYFDACSRLSAMVGRRNVTVLLAKLYAEQMIASKDTASKTQLPSNIPDLMLNYLNELNRTRTEDSPDDRAVHQAAKAVAWECLREEYRPTTAMRVRVVAALVDHGITEGILKYLEERLKVIRTVGPGRDQVGFTLDPLAEYLAALHVVEHGPKEEAAWQDFLFKADQLAMASATISGFLLAVLDCCLAKEREAKVPQSVQAELERRCRPKQLQLVA